MSEDFSQLRQLVDLYEQHIQRQRIAMKNRAQSFRRENDPAPGERTLLDKWATTYEDLEHDLKRDIKEAIQVHPMYSYMVAIRGVSYILTARLLAMLDVRKAPYASSFWKYAGLAVGDFWQDPDTGKIMAPHVGYASIKSNAGAGDTTKITIRDGVRVSVFLLSKPRENGRAKVRVIPRDNWQEVRARDQLIPGFFSPYNRRLKTALHMVATSFQRTDNEAYLDLYREKYDYYINNRPSWARCVDCGTPVTECAERYVHGDHDYRGKGKGWQTGRIHQAAQRYMVKVYLSHVWAVWRELEGLPVHDPYPVAKMDGHKHVHKPVDFGWPAVAK